MRKFKVTKKWPGGPEVGTVYETDNGKVYPFINGDGWRVMGFAISIEELEGFVEEIKEPEEFWYVNIDGAIHRHHNDGVVPNWLRFPTKEHAQEFADGMKSTMSLKIDTVHHCDQVRYLIHALNSRMK